MNILEKMLEVETEARQIVESAKNDANTIRKKAREDAKQLVLDGKKDLEARMHQEIRQIEEEAIAQKERILKESETHLAEMERLTKERIEKTGDAVVTMLLNQLREKGPSS